ncbi:MAG TPA: sulfite exporter TauE/SafE family protein, partial [Candidatus Bathyarchaeia archaeon]|nr:sulfite exporter TauE/SafE family protein [Candidatus Bathyarchaeia archaeon]
MWELILPFLGFLAAIFAVMTGVGGGVFFVPLLTLAYGFMPAQAVGTSLLVIVFSGLSASVSYAKQKQIFFKTGLLLAVATIPGTVVGAFLTSVLPGAVLGLVFGVFLSIVAIRMITTSEIFRRRKTEQVHLKVVESERELFDDKKRFAIGFGLSFFAG